MIDQHKLYSEIQLTTDVMTASSHRLIVLLFDRCMQNMELAKNLIASNDYEKKDKVIQATHDIVQYLRLCLNHEDEKTKELAGRLDAIYAYAQRNLIDANVKHDANFINDAQKIMAEIQFAWNEISETMVE